TSRFLQQDLVIIGDPRQIVETMARGVYPIGGGLDPGVLREFRKQGLGLNLKTLEAESALGLYMITGFGCVSLIDRAPRPNAAKVFINWLLSKDGQASWAERASFTSRRLEIPQPAGE